MNDEKLTSEEIDEMYASIEAFFIGGLEREIWVMCRQCDWIGWAD